MCAMRFQKNVLLWVHLVASPAIMATYQNASADPQLLMADSQIVLRLMYTHWEKKRKEKRKFTDGCICKSIMRKSTVITNVKDRFQHSHTVFLSSPRSPLDISTHTHFGCIRCWAYFYYTKSSPSKWLPPLLHPLSCRYYAQRIAPFPLTLIIWFRRKEQEPFSYFSPLFHQHSLFFCFQSPVLISFQPVIILLVQSCQIPFFVSCTFFYFSRLFKFAPSWLPAYLSALPLSRMVSQSRGEKKWGEEAG